MVDRKSTERKVRRRGTVVTESWKRGASALCEEVIVEHGRCRRGTGARRRRSWLCQKRQHSSCVFPFPVRHDTHQPVCLSDLARYLWNLSLASAFVVNPRNCGGWVGAVTKCRRFVCGLVAVNRCVKIVSEMYGGSASVVWARQICRPERVLQMTVAGAF